MSTNIRRPLYSGTREIDALWFDASLLGEAQARRRVLALWAPGASLYRVASGLLLKLARPVFVDCASAGGLPLCRLDGILSSAPLAPDERATIPHGGCWLVRGAQAHAYQLGDTDRVDPAAWIDLSGIAVRTPLALPEAKVRVALAPPEAGKDLRTILGGAIMPASDRRAEFLRALTSQDGEKQGSALGNAALAVGMLAAAGAGMAARLLARLRPGAGTHGEGNGRSGSSGKAGRAGPQGTLSQRMFAALTAIAMLTRISNVIGWKQAAYLRKMVDMFERGDIAEALRHAIPLGSANDQAAARQMLWTPGERASLEITGPRRNNAVMGVGAEMDDYLRKSYRAMFERLDRAGRIDEATFVLAELLREGMQAVDYLEKHERFRQAAELAETLELDPGLCVRMWVSAGDVERAVRIARLNGAFAEAVILLEKSNHPAAAVLRMQWAEYLFDGGDYIGAVDAIWKLKQYRTLAADWLAQAEKAGHILGARALVRKLLLMPESLASSVPTIDALLERDDEAGPRLRAALAEEILALGSQSAATTRLAAEVLRRVVAERNTGLNNLERKQIDKLLTLADDGMFKSDLPALQFKVAQAVGQQLNVKSPRLQASAGEAGLMPIHDARRLPDGHYLLALGESGIVRVTAAGKRVIHFPIPAYHLVLSQNGDRALALARRGNVLRVGRVDLSTCKFSDWISHPFDAWAPQYDGVVWNAVIDNRIVAIDTTRDTLAVIWQVADLPGKIIDFYDTGVTQTIIMANERELQLWRYSLPARRLMQRDSIGLPPREVTRAMAHSNSSYPMLVTVEGKDGAFKVSLRRPQGSSLDLKAGTQEDQIRVDIREGWIVVQHSDGGGHMDWLIVDQWANQCVAALTMSDAQHPGVAANGGHILLFDRAGRLLDIDCETSTVRWLTLS